jgi:uncharacterized lipoprotein NlpE involved in copper resistance
MEDTCMPRQPGTALAPAALMRLIVPCRSDLRIAIWRSLLPVESPIRLALLGALLLAGCASGPGTGQTPPAGSDTFLGKLPTTFAGVLPCADCPGIRHHLNLWDDNVFHLRREWLDREGLRDDLGTWRIDPASRTLQLSGGAEMPIQFELLADGRLRLLDLAGRHIDSSLPYELSDQGALTEFDLEQFVTGMFIYYADAARLTECLTGRRYPVAMEGDYLALERAYLAKSESPGAPIRVSLEITLADRPQADGPGTERTVIVRRFVGAAPGEQCPTRG